MCDTMLVRTITSSSLFTLLGCIKRILQSSSYVCQTVTLLSTNQITGQFSVGKHSNCMVL